jgi:hypothetical protein
MVRAGQEFSASIIERSVVGNVRVVNGRRAADSGSGCQYWTLGTGNALAIDRLDEWVPEARTRETGVDAVLSIGSDGLHFIGVLLVLGWFGLFFGCFAAERAGEWREAFASGPRDISEEIVELGRRKRFKAAESRIAILLYVFWLLLPHLVLRLLLLLLLFVALSGSLFRPRGEVVIELLVSRRVWIWVWRIGWRVCWLRGLCRWLYWGGNFFDDCHWNLFLHCHWDFFFHCDFSFHWHWNFFLHWDDDLLFDRGRHFFLHRNYDLLFNWDRYFFFYGNYDFLFHRDNDFFFFFFWFRHFFYGHFFLFLLFGVNRIVWSRISSLFLGSRSGRISLRVRGISGLV